MKQTFRVLITVTTESDTKMSDAQVKRILVKLPSLVEEVQEVSVADCDENKSK